MSDPLTTLASIAALILLGYFVWDRYRPHRHSLEVVAEQTLLATFETPGQALHGRLGLVFYIANITNVSSTPFTVKNVLLRGIMDDKRFEEESYVIQTGTVIPKETNAPIPTAMLRVGPDNFFLMRWNNIREVIGERRPVDPGGVLTASAFFPLPISSRNYVSRLRDLQIVVADFQGRESIYDLTILDEWVTTHPNALILNRSFRADGEGNVSFA
jgi:hypothetical protein